MDSVPPTNENVPPTQEELESQVEERLKEIDAEIAKIPDDKIEEALDQETQRWFRMGVNPQGSIGVDMFHVKMQAMALIRILTDKGLFTHEEIQLVFQKEMLKHLVMIREKTERDKIRNQLLANLAQAQQQQPQQKIILKPGDV